MRTAFDAWPPVARGLVHAFYVISHVSAVVGAAVLLARCRPVLYVSWRRAFVLAQVVTVGIYLTWPVAPPNLVSPTTVAAEAIRYELEDRGAPSDGRINVMVGPGSLN